MFIFRRNKKREKTVGKKAEESEATLQWSWKKRRN